MTLFASFDSTVTAEKAAAAIMDRGAREQDISVVAHHRGDGAVELGHGTSDAEEVAKHGLTTTTGADAAMGAAKGLSFGMGLGIIGAIATLFVPGVGLVVGGGALASIIASTAAAGAATGGVIGYLKDQGMGEEVAAAYQARVAAGGAILALQVPTGDITEVEAESLLVKYGALGVFTSYPTTTQDVAPLPVAAPHVVPSEPLETLAPIAPTVTTTPVTTVATPTVAGIPVGPSTVTTQQVVTDVTPTNVVATRYDTVTGLPVEGYVDDVATGMRRPVRYDNGRPFFDAGLPAYAIPTGVPSAAQPVVVEQTTTGAPVVGSPVPGLTPAVNTATVTTVPATAVVQTTPVAQPLGAEVPIAAVTPTRSDPVSGLALEGYVEDPVTGVRRSVVFDQGRAYYVA